MKRPQIIHLVDDTTAGGVMRLLEYICTDPDMGRNAHHSLRVVRKGALSMRRIKADVIVSHLSVSWRTLPALISLRALHADTPLVHVEHSYTQSFTALNVAKKDRFLTLLRIGYAMFDHLVAVSQAQARWMFRHRLADLGALSVISPTVPLASFAALPAPKGPPRTIGAMGRLDRQKGFDLLIPAFRQIAAPDARLIFYGEGPERARLTALAEGDPRIVFAGHSDSPEAAMQSVDAIAMPSRWEAYGLVALEARAAGRPVLVSGIDGLKDQIADGATPVRNYTVEGWSAALQSLLNGDIPAAPRPDAALQSVEFAHQWDQLFRGFQQQTPVVLSAAKA